MLVIVTGLRAPDPNPAQIIEDPFGLLVMVTGKPSASKFRVFWVLLLPLTKIGVVAEEVMLKVSSPVAFGAKPMVAEDAMRVPATVTLAPIEMLEVLAVMVIALLPALIIDPGCTITLLPALIVIGA